MVNSATSSTQNFDRWVAMQAAAIPIIKKRFPNLSAEETVGLVNDILRAFIGAVKEEEERP